jgi:hypothetical protein
MTATWTLDDTLSPFDRGALTARELGSTPHALDRTCTEATLWTGETYRWDKRRGVWVLHDGPETTLRTLTACP